MVVHTCNSSIGEAEARLSCIADFRLALLQSKTLAQESEKINSTARIRKGPAG